MQSPDEQPLGVATWLHDLLRPLEWLERERTAWLALGGAILLYAAVALHVTRGTTLFVDEINIFTADRGLQPSALLAPANGHLYLFERLQYAIDFKLFGAHSFLLPRLAQIVGVAISITLVFTLAKRRVGAAAALAGAVLLLFLGSAWENNLVQSGLGNIYAVSAGLGAFAALERPSRRRDALACLLLVAAVGSFTVGVAFSFGALVLVLLEPGSRRRLGIALIPLALWGAWLIWVRAVYVPAHGEAQSIDLWNILLIPNYIADEAASLFGALAGLNYDFYGRSALPVFTAESQYGPLLVGVAVFALAVRMRRGSLSPLLWAALATLITFWSELAIGFGPGRNPTTVRYVYAGAFLVMLVAAEAAPRVRLSRYALGVIYLTVLLALPANLAHLRAGASVFRNLSLTLRAELTALELAGDRVAPAAKPGPLDGGLQVVIAGPYLAAVARSGSPAFSPAELLSQSETRRSAADAVSVAALRVTLASTPAAHQPRKCRRLYGAAAADFAIARSGAAIMSPTPADLSVRRFAGTTGVRLGTLSAGKLTDLRIPTDRSSRTWHAMLTPQAAALVLCELG